VRRLAPRSLGTALDAVLADARPAGLLAVVQSAWPDVAGAALGASARPVSERSGIVTVACESAVWASELELLAPDLKSGLNAALEASGDPARVERLRFVVGSGANAP
jgi:predicted nucleic acid-binding Zn ribbon protein